MAVTIEEFVVELGWEIDTKGIKQLEKQLGHLKSDLKTVAKAGAVAAAAISAGFVAVMKSFSMIENAEAAFEPVLGSLEKATELVGRLTDTAATTPFQFDTLSKAAKQLLPNMGQDIALTIESIRMLGDTAGGQATKMDSIVRGYNKALLKGKVDMESLNMVAEAGVPIFGELAKTMGVETGPRFFKMISAGKVSTDDLTESLKRMTSEGGMFFRGMEIASRTLSGRLSTLKDNVTMAAADFGDALAPAVKSVVEEMVGGVGGIRAWVRANKDLIRSEGGRWIRGVADALRDTWGFLRAINREVQQWGGWVITIKRIGLMLAAWRLGPIVASLSQINVSMRGLKGVGTILSGGVKNLVSGGLLTLIALLVDDISTTLKGGKGAFYEWGDAIAEAAMGVNELSAQMLGMPLDEFNLAFIQGINDIGSAFSVADDQVKLFFENILEYAFQALISIDNFGDQIVDKIGGAVSKVWRVLKGLSVNMPLSVGVSNDRLLPQPSRPSQSTTNNDNRVYRVSPTATINQNGADLRSAERAISRSMEQRFNNALRTIG